MGQREGREGGEGEGEGKGKGKGGTRPSFERNDAHAGGPTAGDPLGPLSCTFCHTIHPLLTSLQSDLTLGYLDDLTMAGQKTLIFGNVYRF